MINYSNSNVNNFKHRYSYFSTVQYYQDFACCAAVPGNGANKEYALHLLQITGGDIKVCGSLSKEENMNAKMPSSVCYTL